MDNLSTQLYQQIEIIIQKGKVYLHNKTAEMIEELVYETASMLTTDDVIAVSATPTYQIMNIPPNKAVLLEILDGWEDGKISYYLTKVKTKTIDFQGNINLKIKYLSGMIALPQIVDGEIVKLGSKDGFVVDTAAKADNPVNDLYWLAEDLLAYTDLTGEQFDTEKAQLKLWKMNSILSKNDFPKVQELQENLLGRLEIPMFFEKEEFAAKVNELYQLLMKMKNGEI